MFATDEKCCGTNDKCGIDGFFLRGGGSTFGDGGSERNKYRSCGGCRQTSMAVVMKDAKGKWKYDKEGTIRIEQL